MTTLLVSSNPVSISGKITDLGKLEVGTKIQFSLTQPAETHLAFVQEPNSNKITAKASKDGSYTKNWTVIKLDDGRVAVQGWPSNGFYLATTLGEGKVNLTFFSVVTRRAHFYFVEETQIVVFHKLMDKPFTAQLKGLRTVTDHIVTLVKNDELTKMAYDNETLLPVGSVLWYSMSRAIGAVITAHENDEYVCARVHVSQILGMPDTLPHLVAGQMVTWESTKDLGEGTTFKTELVGVRVK